MSHKRIQLFIVVAGLSLSMSSCKFIKNIFNTELSDEDYIVGQLYADEYVKDTPVRYNNRSNDSGTSPTPSGSDTKTGITLNSKDNRKLYAAIDAWYGTPYLYGGCTTDGVDCSCFVGNVFKTVYGVSLHRVASDIQKDVTPVKRQDLKEGDIVFFVNSKGKVGHVGIYLKEDLFVHSSTSHGVIVSSLENSYWKQHFYKGGRHKSVKTKY